jgi:hypothetical protein
MLDIIEFKVNMMLQQIGDDFISKREIRGALEELIDYNAQNDDYEEEVVEETGGNRGNSLSLFCILPCIFYINKLYEVVAASRQSMNHLISCFFISYVLLCFI